MAAEAAWRKLSDSELTRHLKPLLEEAYGPLPANEAWLEQLVQVLRTEMGSPADAVSLAAWAFADGVDPDETAAAALARESARPVLVHLVAELAHVVLLDKATAARIIQHLQAQFSEESGWEATGVEAIVRAALTGTGDGPPLAPTMALLGRERCMRRVAATLQ